MRIVCDTGPLIGLAKIDCLYILKDIGSFIDELRNKGYWLSDELTVLARRLAGEYDADEERVNE